MHIEAAACPLAILTLCDDAMKSGPCRVHVCVFGGWVGELEESKAEGRILSERKGVNAHA